MKSVKDFENTLQHRWEDILIIESSLKQVWQQTGEDEVLEVLQKVISTRNSFAKMIMHKFTPN